MNLEEVTSSLTMSDVFIILLQLRTFMVGHIRQDHWQGGSTMGIPWLPARWSEIHELGEYLSRPKQVRKLISSGPLGHWGVLP